MFPLGSKQSAITCNITSTIGSVNSPSFTGLLSQSTTNHLTIYASLFQQPFLDGFQHPLHPGQLSPRQESQWPLSGCLSVCSRTEDDSLWFQCIRSQGMCLINLGLNSSLSNIQQCCNERMQYPSTQEVFEWCWNIDENEMFLDLWQNDFLQVTSRVTHCSLCWLGLEPYSWAVFKQRLKLRGEPRNVERMLCFHRSPYGISITPTVKSPIRGKK